ncbi:hypothetical protein Moror_4131 [Moniliophthora roreri MCA 2997]|uniref:Uncharacterized protein n=1 Tax=Moniliophthora roreri (strain MCA 2997) TaxID=1381753 RepID=V2XAB9_MONRO|nr:hypothetical protein Moror_4131 [Moniliophthora roreri MCA 2997]
MFSGVYRQFYKQISSISSFLNHKLGYRDKYSVIASKVVAQQIPTVGLFVSMESLMENLLPSNVEDHS